MARISHLFQSAPSLIRRSFTAGVGLLTIAKYIGTGLSLVTSVLAARILGPREYGLAVLLMGFPWLVWSFASVKSLSVTTRYMARFRSTGQLGELGSICKLGFLVDAFCGLVAASLIAVSANWVLQDLLHTPNRAWLVVMFGFSLPFYSLVSTSCAILSSCERFRQLAGVQVFDRFVTFLLVGSALLMGWGVSGMILATAAAQAIVGVSAASIATLVLRSEGLPSWRGASLHSIEHLRKELKGFFGWNYLLATFTGLIGQGPALMLGRFRGPEPAGFYRLAMSMLSASSYIQSSVLEVVYPRLSIRWATENREAIRATLWRWSRNFGLPLALALLGVAALMPIAIPTVYGAAYTAMVPGAQFLLVGAAVSGLFFHLTPFYYAAGRFSLWGKATGVYAAFVIALSPIVIDVWGFPGAAALVALGNVALNLSMAGVVARMPLYGVAGVEHAELKGSEPR